MVAEKTRKKSVSWRLPEVLVDKLSKEARERGMKLPAFIIMILTMRYESQ